MTTTRRKVLLSAYACGPGRGSEPGLGWNALVAIARDHDVWVLTCLENWDAIQNARATRLYSSFSSIGRSGSGS